MSDPARTQFSPDYVVPPGETLRETIEALAMTQAELAERTSRPKKTINEIVKGKAAITTETAIQFERVLGVPARIWNSLEMNYQERLARLEEQMRLEEDIAWLNTIPWRKLAEYGLIEAKERKIEILAHVLNFFGVASRQAWESYWLSVHAGCSFKESKAFRSNPGAVAAWLRIGELRARGIECAPYDASEFRKTLKCIRKLTTKDPDVFQPLLEEWCANCGVAVVFFPELPKTRLCGATRWLNPRKALLQLSLRYKTDDQLWFTFFHEAVHILKHRKLELYLEDPEVDEMSHEEREADAISENILISNREFKEFVSKGIY